MWERPDMTAADLGEVLGRSAAAVRGARQRHGRWKVDATGHLCALCGERPVWEGNRQAERAGLCMGCWTKEAGRRLDEETARATMRKRLQRFRKRYGYDPLTEDGPKEGL